MDTVINLLLPFPSHGVFSRNIMWLTFTRRKSGNWSTTRACCHQEEKHIADFSHRTWWQNLADGASVLIWLRGKWLKWLAYRVGASQEFVTMVYKSPGNHAEEYANRMGFWLNDLCEG